MLNFKGKYACEISCSTFALLTIRFDFKQFMNVQIKQVWNLKGSTLYVSQHAKIRKCTYSKNGTENFGSDVILGISESIVSYPISLMRFWILKHKASKWVMEQPYFCQKLKSRQKNIFLTQWMEVWNVVSYL